MRTTTITAKRVAAWFLTYNTTSDYKLHPMNSVYYSERAAKAAAIRLIERFKEVGTGKATATLTPLYRDKNSCMFLPGRGATVITFDHSTGGTKHVAA